MKHEIEYLEVEKLIPYARNSRTHSDEQVAQVAASIKEFGFTNPVLVDQDGMIIAGHGRTLAAQRLQIKEVPCLRLSHLSESQKRAYVIADNKLALNAGWDDEMLALELQDLKDSDFNLELTGFDDQELNDILSQAAEDGLAAEEAKGKLSERFGIAPFTVLNAREGWWQDRKRSWLALGIKSELGRGDNMLGFSQACNLQQSSGKAYPNEKSKFGKVLETNIGEKYGREEMDGTSVFDPVLCELSYKWFSPPGGIILDPFAGGSVRGVVASKLGRQYIGHELRKEQVEANRVQADEICEDFTPVWHIGDSRKIDKSCHDVQADMVYSCPPYADLEVYSDDPEDLSNMPYEKFLELYREIIFKSCSLLKDDSFACFVVGDVRDKKGNYRNFVGDTVEAFRDAGLNYYNEAILITAVGSLPIRAGKIFTTSRKLGKTHQNVLIFVKGDGKKATEKCGPVEFFIDEEAATTD